MIEVFTKSDCIWCDKLKEVLKGRDLPYREIEVDTRNPTSVDEFLTRTEGASSVPQVVIGKRVLGGFTKFVSMIDTSEFQQMIGGK